jgi:1-acyl-sn-glycerol-3-phosphate acyltransferase
MLYQLTKPVAKIAFLIFFRKIYFSNRQAVPEDKPVILAANHPTAFIEPCILACWLGRPLYFIARGDLYLNPLFKKLYDWYHLIPVFRVEDAGYGKLKRNYSSFDRCFDALNGGKMVMILAEGVVKQEKRLRPLRKGSARIAFGALEKYPDLDLHIVPVGVNYTFADRFRSEVMINFGEPIRLKDYLAEWQNHSARATNALTDDLTRRLRQEVIHISSEKDETLAEQLFELIRHNEPEHPFPVISAKHQAFEAEKNIADEINRMSAAAKDQLRQKADRYFCQLQDLKITDRGLMHAGKISFAGVFFIVLGFPFYLVGYVVNYPPLWLAYQLAKKVSPSIEFVASSAIAFGMALYGLYFFVTLGLGYAIASLAGLIVAAALPAVGYLSLIYRDFYEKWREAKKASNLAVAIRQDLLNLRKEVLTYLD